MDPSSPYCLTYSCDPIPDAASQAANAAASPVDTVSKVSLDSSTIAGYAGFQYTFSEAQASSEPWAIVTLFENIRDACMCAWNGPYGYLIKGAALFIITSFIVTMILAAYLYKKRKNIADMLKQSGMVMTSLSFFKPLVHAAFVVVSLLAFQLAQIERAIIEHNDKGAAVASDEKKKAKAASMRAERKQKKVHFDGEQKDKQLEARLAAGIESKSIYVERIDETIDYTASARAVRVK